MYYYNDESGRAISASEKALKYLPSNDKEYYAFVYSIRGDVYANLVKNYDKAIGDYAKSLSYITDEKVYEKRADAYFQKGDYKSSNKDYKKCLEIDESNILAHMGIGRNSLRQNNYKEALNKFDYVVQLHPSDYSIVYSFRAETYIHMGEYIYAVDDVVKALSIDAGDQKAFSLLDTLSSLAHINLISRLNIQKNKDPNNYLWPYFIAYSYEMKENYIKAIELYKESLSLQEIVQSYYRIADCMQEIGDFKHAIDYINKGMESCDDDYCRIRLIANRQGIYYEMGNYDSSIKDLDECIKAYPEYYFNYYRRGWVKTHTSDLMGALEDYTTSITLEPKYAYAYLSRGNLYRKLGEYELANKDFKRSIELDDVMTQMSCAPYAYFYLGDNKKAKQYMDTMLKYQDCYYDAACLYSLMNEKQLALNYFRKAMDKGYYNFSHIEKDVDLDNIRNTSEFKQILSNAKQKLENMYESDSQIEYVEKFVEIPFEKRNGVNEVKCTINGLPLYFIFDTGASDVTISSVEAAFMLKNRYLTEKDILGKTSYQIANGDIAEGTIINLEEVEIGDLKLSNVRASVIKGQTAPLLLGQTALARLGKIEIDNSKKVLRIRYKEEKK